MKNAIQYYYGLFPLEIHQKKGTYEFKIQNMHYYLTPCQRSNEELMELYKISKQLFERNIYCHQFILNNNQNIITIINQIPYILLQIFVDCNVEITLEHILFFSNLVVSGTENNPLLRSKWKQLWIEKNDYCEYQVSQFGKQFPIIRESFSYFIGVSEIAISLLDGNELSDLVISHRRIQKKDTLFDLYNPLNFVFDYKERDIVEYYKSLLIEDKLEKNEIEKIIYLLQTQNYNSKLFLARAFYPTFYFDWYEQIIHNYINETEIEKIIDKIDQYEMFLSILYINLRSNILLPDITWLTKNIG